MDIAALHQEIEGLKQGIVEITKSLKDRTNSEVADLAVKLADVQKELATRKQQFEAASADQFKSIDAKVMDQKRDEILIARALLRNEDGRLNETAYTKTLQSAEYRDVVKASGFTFSGTVPDGQVSGGDGTAAGYGSNFVVPGFSQTLLEEIWLKLEIANLFKRFNMPNSTFVFPFAHDQITARLGKEATAPTKDKFGTGTLQFTAKKIMANIDFTDEVEADSLIAILPLVREKLIAGFALGQEQIALNGDQTVGVANVNGTLAADDVRLAAKGIRAHGMAANSKLDFATGGFSADNLRALRAKLGKYGKNPGDLCYIVSMDDYFKTLGFTGYQYLYQYSGAIVERGELGRIDNIPLIVSELMPVNLNATGGADTPTGKHACAIVNKAAFMWGDRKEFALETFRNPYIQTNSLIGSQRLDFQKVMSTTSIPVACGYNY